MMLVRHGTVLGGEASCWACSVQKARDSKSYQRLFQEQHPLLSLWASMGFDSPPRHGRVTPNHAVALCVCVKQPTALAVLLGKGKGSAWM